jgi:hypothetical protein
MTLGPMTMFCIYLHPATHRQSHALKAYNNKVQAISHILLDFDCICLISGASLSLLRLSSALLLFIPTDEALKVSALPDIGHRFLAPRTPAFAFLMPAMDDDRSGTRIIGSLISIEPGVYNVSSYLP